MSDVLNILLGLVLLVFVTYVVIFGGTGALLSRHRGGSLIAGFTIGLTPLIGLPLVLWITRSGKRRFFADERPGPEKGERQPVVWPSEARQSSPPSLPVAENDPHDY